MKSKHNRGCWLLLRPTGNYSYKVSWDLMPAPRGSRTSINGSPHAMFLKTSEGVSWLLFFFSCFVVPGPDCLFNIFKYTRSNKCEGKIYFLFFFLRSTWHLTEITSPLCSVPHSSMLTRQISTVLVLSRSFGGLVNQYFFSLDRYLGRVSLGGKFRVGSRQSAIQPRPQRQNRRRMTATFFWIITLAWKVNESCSRNGPSPPSHPGLYVTAPWPTSWTESYGDQ